jgi:hypothetical protein
MAKKRVLSLPSALNLNLISSKKAETEAQEEIFSPVYTLDSEEHVIQQVNYENDKESDPYFF